MSRLEIKGKFGEPVRTQLMTKTSTHVWGPIEDFWHGIPEGASIEIWSYYSYTISRDNEKESRQPGQTELYFVNDSAEVNGIGFYIEGAVY